VYRLELSIPLVLFLVIGVFFFFFGMYSLVTGKMRSGNDTVHNGKVIVGFKARLMGLLMMVLGPLVALIGFLFSETIK